MDLYLQFHIDEIIDGLVQCHRARNSIIYQKYCQELKESCVARNIEGACKTEIYRKVLTLGLLCFAGSIFVS